jgi:AAA family ATP:ADP antiporter
VLSREDRYKAKNFIDTVIYRLGDQAGAWSYTLVGFLGWGGAALPIIAIPISALWLANAIWLGRRQEDLAARAPRAATLPSEGAKVATVS